MELADYGIKGAMKSKTVADATPGDVVRFDTFSMFVEKVSEIRHNKISLSGWISTGGSPYVTRNYFTNTSCRIEKA